MKNSGRLAVLFAVALAISTTAFATQGVSPGATDRMVVVESRCPTFSWGMTAEAVAYDLVAYVLPDDASEPVDLTADTEVLFTRVAGSATSWTPSAEQCFAPGGHYVWFVRTVTEMIEEQAIEAGEWSEGRYFEVPEGPTDDEIARAIEVLKRWEAAGGSLSLSSAAVPAAATVSVMGTGAGHLKGEGEGHPKSVPTASAAIRGDNPETDVEAYGLVGTSASVDGAGVAAANTEGGPDLVLDGSLDGATDTILSEWGIARTSGSNEHFQIVNYGGGDMTLDVVGTVAATGLDCPDCVGPSELANEAVTSAAIEDDGVTETDIAPGAVNSTHIFDGSIRAQDLAAGSVDGTAVADGSITAADLQDGAVSSQKLATAAVTTAKLDDGAVTADKIANGAVAASQIAPGSIGETELADEAVTNSKIAPGSVDSSSLADAAVTGTKLAGGSVGASALRSNAVTLDKIADDAVTGAEILDGSVTMADLAPESVGSDEIEDGGVSSSDIDFNAVGSDHLADGSVTTAKLAVGAVATASLADGSVTSAIIGDGAVTAAKLAPGAIGPESLADGSVTSATIADGTITGADLAIGAVTASRIQDQAVGGSKIAPGAVTETKILAGSVTGEKLANGTVTAQKVVASEIQLRVGSQCPAGSSIRSIDPTGAVTCEAAGGGDLTPPVIISGLSNGSAALTVTNQGDDKAIAGITGFGLAIFGQSTADFGIGVVGSVGGEGGFGVEGIASGGNGVGLYGEATADGSTGVKGLGFSQGGYFESTGLSYGSGIVAKGGPSGSAAVFIGNVTIRDRDTNEVVIELGKGLDYAEGFDVSDVEPLEAGTVLIIDPENPGELRRSTLAYDTRVAGIIAGANDLGSGVRLGAEGFEHDVALAGRVYCKADATEAGIRPGDLLTTSPIPGHAMKASDADRARGAILGKAMEPLDAGRTGQILVLVGLQ